MGNPYAEFVAPPKPPGAPEGNPYLGYTAGPTIDETEQDVVARVNNPNEESPPHFGLTPIEETPVSLIDRTYKDFLKNTAIGAGRFAQSIANAGFIGMQAAGDLGQEATDIGAADIVKPEVQGKPQSLMAANFLGLKAAGSVLQEKLEGYLNDAFGARPDGWRGVVQDVGSVGGGITTSIGMTLATRNPAYAAELFGAIQGTQTYQKAITSKEDPKSPQEAFGLALGTGASVAAIEAVGGKGMMALATSAPVKRIAARIVGQGAEEAAQQAAVDVIHTESGIEKMTGEQMAWDIFYNGLLGMIGGAGTVTIATAMEERGKKLGMPRQKIQEVVDNFIKNQDDLDGALSETIHRDGVADHALDRKAVSETLGEMFAEDQRRQDEANDPENFTPDERKFLQTYLSEDEKLALKDEGVDIAIQEDAVANAIAAYAKQAEIIRAELSEQIDINNKRQLEKALGYKPITLAEYLRTKGGIADDSGELAARDITHKSLPGLVRKKGAQQLDYLKESAFDAGYFPDKSDYNEISDSEFYDSLAQDVGGKRIYNRDTASRIEQIAAESSASKYAEAGITSDMSVEQIAAILEDAPPGSILRPDENDPRFNGDLDAILKILDDKKRQGIYIRVMREARNSLTTGDKAAELGADIKRMIGNALTPISTRLKNIHPKLKARMRRYEFELRQQINADQAAVTPFLEKFSELPRAEKTILDFAMKNGDMDTINKIAEAHDMVKEIAAVRDTLNGIYARGTATGLEISYRKDYFPRQVIKAEKLVAHFRKDKDWGQISEALRSKERELGAPLSVEDKAELINTLLRGYGKAQIALAKPGALKERKIDRITPEIMNYYGPTDQAILRYIAGINTNIETRKFFGKGTDATKSDNIEDSIASFILHEMAAGHVKSSQQDELTEILRARFSQGRMGAFLRTYKNIEYLSVMGSPTSAITQLGDIAFSIYKNGFYRTGAAAPRALAGRSEVTREDIGAEHIAHEFEDPGTAARAVRRVFKIIGFDKMDRLGKETLINGALGRYRAQAKKPTAQFKESLQVIFGKETDTVIADLKAGKVSENVKLLLFNELLDVQPVALSEMPVAYLRMGNGRILYMLKSFTLKQFDIYRAEVFSQMATNPVLALKNLTYLAGLFVMMNASADFLKDLLLGRESEPDDIVVNNIMRVIGVTKYQAQMVQRDGPGKTAFNTIAPPTSLIDKGFRDLETLAEEGDIDVDNIESVANAPIAGKLYYWWMGAGSEK